VAKGRCVCLTLDRGAFERLLGPCQDILDRAEAEYAEADRRAAQGNDSGSEPQDSPPLSDDDEPAAEAPAFRPPPRGRRTGVSAEAMTSSVPFEKKSYPKNEEQRNRLRSCLKANILFSHLTDADLTDIVDAFFAVSKRDGDVIIEQGGEGDNFYIIDSGLCDIYVAKGSGPSNKVFTAQAGGSFGELALMYNCPRAATVKANGPVTLWALDRQTFQQTMKASQSSKQERYSEFLTSVPLLESLTREEISKICDVLEVKMFGDGEYIIRQGDDGQDFFVISEGEGTVRKSMAPGQPEVSIVDLKVGNFFGELALLKDQPRAASVVAKGRCVCLTLDRGAFERLLGPCQDILDRAEAEYAEADRRAAEH
jgi:CRP-like cAMP-binding protein